MQVAAQRRGEEDDEAEHAHPLECGRWAEYTLGIAQNAALIRKAQDFGFEMTAFEEAVIARAEVHDITNIDLEFEVFRRAMAHVNEIAPDGYRLGFKEMDLWFMPAQWWEDTGGEE